MSAPEVHTWSVKRLVALALVSGSVLSQELVLTRLFSATIWYYFAFLTVSVALIGLGSGAIWVHLRGWGSEQGREDPRAGSYAVASCVAAVASLTVYLFLYPSVGTQSAGGIAALCLIIVCFCAPAFCSGVCVTMLIYAMSSRPGVAYAADLVGAALGTGLAIGLLELGPPHQALVLIALCAGLAGLLMLHRQVSVSRWVVAAAGVAGALCWGLLALPGLEVWQLRFARDRVLPPIRVEAWNSISRITVHRETRGHWGLPKIGRKARLPQQLDLKIDGGAQTAVTRFSGDLSTVAFLADDLESLPFHVLGRRTNSALVLGSGGGNGVLVARLMGATAVQAVEINPLIPRLLFGRLKGFADAVYMSPGVKLAVEDARTFVRRDQRRYDVVTLTYVDTLASSSGAYALTENYLYTIEAFSDFMARTKQDGVFGFLRTRSVMPADTLKAVLLACEALRRRGVEDPGRHLAIVGTWVTRYRGVSQVVLKRTPLSPAEIERIRRFASKRGFDLLYLPGASSNHPVYETFLSAKDPKPLMDAYAVDVSPPSDDSPFFFFNLGESDQQDLSVKLIPVTGAILLGLAAALMWFLPRCLGRVTDLPMPYTLLFICLGFGFMLVEFVLMQRFILLLGHPIYSLGTTIAGLLIGLSSGSLLSRRVIQSQRHLFISLFAAALAVLLVATGQGCIIDASIHADLWQRVLVVLALVVPLGCVMGLQLPSALRLMSEAGHRSAIPWAWAANSFASVLAAVSSVGLGITVGFSATLWIGVTFYLLAMLFLKRWRTAAPSEH